MKTLELSQIKKLAESLGFRYRAQSASAATDKWITFTYEGTNTHVILIKPADYSTVMKQLGDELVRCGRIQQRQTILKEINIFNYD